MVVGLAPQRLQRVEPDVEASPRLVDSDTSLPRSVLAARTEATARSVVSRARSIGRDYLGSRRRSRVPGGEHTPFSRVDWRPASVSLGAQTAVLALAVEVAQAGSRCRSPRSRGSRTAGC